MRSILAALVLCLALPPAARAGDGRSFVVGYESLDYLPYYARVGGEFAGVARRLLDAFAAEKGYTFTYKGLPVDRLFRYFLDGRVGFKFPDNPVWRRELRRGQAIAYSDPLFEFVDGVSVLPANLGRGAAALESLGTIRGFTVWDYLDRVEAGRLTVRESNSFDSLIRMGLYGRVDGVYANVDVIRHRLAEGFGRQQRLVFDPALPHTRSHYHLSTLKHAGVLAELDAWMAENRERVAAMEAEFGLR